MNFLSPKDLVGYVSDKEIPPLLRALNHIIRRRVAEKLGLFCAHKPVMKAYQHPESHSEYVCELCGDDLEIIALTKDPGS